MKINTVLVNKKDLVIVGGMALYLHGLKSKYTDIDIVVTNLDGIEGAIEYETDSYFSATGKRAYVLTEDSKLDIFIQELPEYQIIQGYKVQTLDSMLKYYQDLLPKVRPHWHEYIQEKINLIQSWKQSTQ